MAEHTEETTRWYNSEGYVYFIGAGAPVTAIKIGVTVRTKIKQRIRSHQTSNHEVLRILGVIPTETMIEAEELEKSLHSKYTNQQRFKQGTSGHEWFTATDELINEIDQLSQKPDELNIQAIIAEVGPGIKYNA